MNLLLQRKEMQEYPRNIAFLLLISSLIFSPSTQNQEDQESYNSSKTTKIRDPFLSLISNNSSSVTCRSGKLEKVRLRARVSMEVDTGHLPDLCRLCQRPEGCGAALRCLCHPKECKNKVVNFGIGTKTLALSGNTKLVLLFSMAMFFIM